MRVSNANRMITLYKVSMDVASLSHNRNLSRSDQMVVRMKGSLQPIPLQQSLTSPMAHKYRSHKHKAVYGLKQKPKKPKSCRFQIRITPSRG